MAHSGPLTNGSSHPLYPSKNSLHCVRLLWCVKSSWCGLGKGLPAEVLCNCITEGFATHLKALSLLQKELGQKDRLLQQHQTKLEEALRRLSDASYQQVRTYSATDFPVPLA